MSQDAFSATLDFVISKDNPTGKFMTKHIKNYINKLAAKLPDGFLIQLDPTYYDVMPEKSMVLVDWRLGLRLMGQGYFEFIPGKEIDSFPSKVYTNACKMVRREDHKTNLKQFFKSEGKEGIISYVNIAFSAVKMNDVYNIENSKGQLKEPSNF